MLQKELQILAKKIEEGFKIVAPIASCALMLKISLASFVS